MTPRGAISPGEVTQMAKTAVKGSKKLVRTKLDKKVQPLMKFLRKR